jgi:hypothetical protein
MRHFPNRELLKRLQGRKCPERGILDRPALLSAFSAFRTERTPKPEVTLIREASQNERAPGCTLSRPIPYDANFG